MCQVEAAIQSVEKLLKDYGHPPLPREVFFIFFIKVFLRQANIFRSPKFISDTNMSATEDSCSASFVLMMPQYKQAYTMCISKDQFCLRRQYCRHKKYQGRTFLKLNFASVEQNIGFQIDNVFYYWCSLSNSIWQEK